MAEFSMLREAHDLDNEKLPGLKTLLYLQTHDNTENKNKKILPTTRHTS